MPHLGRAARRAAPLPPYAATTTGKHRCPGLGRTPQKACAHASVRAESGRKQRLPAVMLMASAREPVCSMLAAWLLVHAQVLPGVYSPQTQARMPSCLARGTFNDAACAGESGWEALDGGAWHLSLPGAGASANCASANCASANRAPTETTHGRVMPSVTTHACHGCATSMLSTFCASGV